MAMLFPIPHQTVETLKNLGMLLPFNPNMIPNPNQVQSLQSALLEDAQSYLYNGIVSFGAAVNSIGIKNYGWAVVKLYYTVFYLARSKLAINHFAIVYDQNTPYLLSWSSFPAVLKKQTGKEASSTHKLILKLLKEHFPSNHLSNYRIGINNIPTLDWLMKQREIMNYTSAMMPDPEPPEILTQIVRNPPLNKWLETYKDDPAGYAIDEDHACLAYPFLLLLEVLNEFKQKQISPKIQNNLNFIKNLLKEKDKNLEAVLCIIRDCCN